MDYTCNNCYYRSPSPHALINHCWDTGHNPRFQCEECDGRPFVNARALQDHLDTACIHCKCPYCNKAAFPTRTALEQHIRDKHLRGRIIVANPPNEHTPLVPRDDNEEENTKNSFWRTICCCFC